MRHIKMRLTRLTTALTITAMAACSQVPVGEDFSQTESAEEEAAEAGYSDLRMFELHGNVKTVVRDTYYNVDYDGITINVDTTASARRSVDLYFDRLGNYVASEHELVKRDDKGRIVYWRDRRPNAKGVDPGILRDTLAYTHVNDNVLVSSGMSEYAIAVYDNDGRIVGQYSKPTVEGTSLAAFNVYTAQDNNGNWTERLTIWTSNAPGKRPHVSYTVDRRTIEYYE